ncbi:MAG: BMP family ABC transporter substrate-binding protein [Candidatus Promineifilaceae bacterium]|nr:BMP family ABC transporter substrate-binding protein [Candidatus Promineifilaceae bacterium]
MRKLSLLLTLLLLFSLALVACDAGDADLEADESELLEDAEDEVVEDVEDTDVDVEEEDVAEADEDDCSLEEVFCVGLVTDVGEIDDKSFNQSAWEGVLLASDELGARADYVETNDAKDYANNISLFADNDYDAIVTVGFALGEATLIAASEYPEVDFVGVDQFIGPEPPDGWAGEWPPPNVAGLIFPEDQAGFMAGALAAMLSETGTIAAVLGTDAVPPVVAFKEGYEAGAAYINPDIEVISTYHPGGLDVAFTDPEWGATTAAQAIDQGADVIFGAGGKTGNGALIEVANHEGVYCIGVDTDQWLTVPEAHSCLVSSAMKLITSGVFTLLEASENNNLPAGVFVGDVGLAPFHDFEDEIDPSVTETLAEIEAGLEAGEIDTGYAP